MNAITIDPAELRSLIHEAVKEAFDEQMHNLRHNWDDEVSDAALARAMDEALAQDEPVIPLPEFRKQLQAQINES